MRYECGVSSENPTPIDDYEPTLDILQNAEAKQRSSSGRKRPWTKADEGISNAYR